MCKGLMFRAEVLKLTDTMSLDPFGPISEQCGSIIRCRFLSCSPVTSGILNSITHLSTPTVSYKTVLYSQDKKPRNISSAANTFCKRTNTKGYWIRQHLGRRNNYITNNSGGQVSSLTVRRDLEGWPQRTVSETWVYKKLRDLSPRANYTDRATAACRRS
jgi:hypothetical protein